jgi:CHAD domain-containing protein
MLEVEVKLAVEGSFAPSLEGRPGRAAELPGAGVAGVEELPPLDLRATYHDTPDLRLARNGITLRHRTGEAGGAAWTLKLPTDDGRAARDASSRDELEFEGPGNVVPDEAEELLAAFVRSTALSPVARLRTRRRRWSLRDADGHEVAELVDDRVSVLQRGRVVERFREVELEGKGLDREAVERIARVLAEDGASAAPQVPKLVRALGSRAMAPPEIVAPERLSPADPAGAAVRAAIARGVERIMLNDPRTRLGEVEPLHQMRVGARRLRSDLRTFRPLVDRDWADSLRSELRWLGAVLGDVRDLDVMIDRLRRDAGELEDDLEPMFDALEARRAEARAALREALRTSRYVELLDRLVDAAENPELTPAASGRCKDALPPLVRRSWKKLRKQGRPLGPGSSDAEFHRVRVLAKWARYGAEAIAPALGRKRGKQAEKFADRAADLQDVLGELQDSVVARDTILDVAGEHPPAGSFNLAAGRLVERELHGGQGHRERFPAAWRRLDRKKRLRWL